MAEPTTFTMTLVLDEDDYRDIQAEIALRQARGGAAMLPDGDSNLAGAYIAEAVRDLTDYRDLFSADRQREPPDA